MFFAAVAMLAVGYALAFTGADKIVKKGAAPSLLYNLGISSDATPGKAIGASFGGDGATITTAQLPTQPNQQTTTPVGPVMPVPLANAQPSRYI